MNILIDNAIFSLQSQGGISKLWRNLLPALRDAMPDATFTPQLPPDVFISTYYKRAPLGVKSLVLCYDLIAQVYPLISSYRADSVDARLAIGEAVSIVAISQQTANDVKRLCNRECVVAHPGIAPEFGKVNLSEVEAFQGFVGKPYVLVVGNRGLYKNVQTLYQAWGIWGAAKEHKLLCIGGEKELPQDTAFANRYGDSWMHMTLDDHDLALAYAGATALVYPSFMEGFGLPLLEAMATGCPIVCDMAMGEVTHQAAIYCDTARPRQIAAALDMALDPSVRVKLAVYGSERAKAFRWSDMATKLADVIRRTI